MKVADLEIGNAGPQESGFLSRLRRALGKQQKKAKLPPTGAGRKSVTATSRSLPEALRAIEFGGHATLGVYGDQAFFRTVQSTTDRFKLHWMSPEIIQDPSAGADRLSADGIGRCDALLVGGSDVATIYRHALRIIHANGLQTPVHWVADNWEFCAGTIAVPAEIDDLDALVFNHFEEFFGIKDPLQFSVELISETGKKQFYRILGPSESFNVNLSGIAPERSGAVCLKIYVAHPTLTRGRHYRFRICGDMFWEDSFTIVHGSHQFSKNPDKRQSFRLIDSVSRAGSVIITVPNYDLDMGKDDEIGIEALGERRAQKRSRTAPVEIVRFEHNAASAAKRNYYAASYAGYGTSFWFAFDKAASPKIGKRGSLAANHLCRVGVEDRKDILFTPEERRIVEGATRAGFMIHPCCVPVSAPGDALAFGFNFDASNPPFEDYWLRFYGDEGVFLGDFQYRKDRLGPVLIDDVVARWPGERKHEVRMTLVAPDYLKVGLAPQRLVTTADLLVRHRETGDQDFTEFQSSWRNLGTSIPTLPHWLHPSIGIMGRTNVIGRVRTKGGYRTGVLIANASGNLTYDTPAEAEISAINHRGRRLSHHVKIPAFGLALIWLDDVMPDLGGHVGDSGIATLQVKSADADMTAQVIGLAPNGAVGLQHLWGY